MSKPTAAPEIVECKDFWDWKGHQAHLMYHGDGEVLVTLVQDDAEGLFFKRAETPDELLFVPWPRIKQIRGPASYTREPKPAPVKKKSAPKKPLAKKAAPTKAPQAELLGAEAGAA